MIDHEGTVELLLGREDVNPDIPDTECGQTPLSWAAENGHEGIVKLLLGREDVNPTPLTQSVAKRRSHGLPRVAMK